MHWGVNQIDVVSSARSHKWKPKMSSIRNQALMCGTSTQAQLQLTRRCTDVLWIFSLASMQLYTAVQTKAQEARVSLLRVWQRPVQILNERAKAS